MNNKLSLMEKDIQQALADASAAAAAASVNAAEIQNLKDYVKDLKNALDNLQISDDKELEDLKEKICCLEGELATMWVSIALLEGEAIAHFEAAKCYADQQIEAVKLSLMLEVKALLADYLKKGDIDFTQYVTKAEIANYVTKAEAASYATKAELANYVSKDVYDQLVAQLTTQMGGLTNADAALRVALENLTQEMYISSLKRVIQLPACAKELLRTRLILLGSKIFTTRSAVRLITVLLWKSLNVGKNKLRPLSRI
jgi:hypothetical protein